MQSLALRSSSFHLPFGRLPAPHPDRPEHVTANCDSPSEQTHGASLTSEWVDCEHAAMPGRRPVSGNAPSSNRSLLELKPLRLLCKLCSDFCNDPFLLEPCKHKCTLLACSMCYRSRWKPQICVLRAVCRRCIMKNLASSSACPICGCDLGDPPFARLR